MEAVLLHVPVQVAASGSLPLWLQRYQGFQRLQDQLQKDARDLLVRNLDAADPLAMDGQDHFWPDRRARVQKRGLGAGAITVFCLLDHEDLSIVDGDDLFDGQLASPPG